MTNIDLAHLRVLTHSAIRLESADGKTVIYADPFELAEAPHDATLVLITHAHYDHFSPRDIARVANSGTEIIAPRSMAKEVSELGYGEAHLVAAGDAIAAGGVRIEAVAAYNTDPARLDKHPRANGWLGYVVTLDDVRYYIAGDTDENEDNLRVRCDVALVPVGGTFTMDPAQAASFVGKIHPRAAVPTHYGSIVGTMEDGDAFAAAVPAGIDVALKLGRDS